MLVVFDITQFLKVPDEDLATFHNYGYILVKQSTYKVPIKPYFMSYDYSRKKTLVGTFRGCAGSSTSAHSDSIECVLHSGNKLAWFKGKNVNENSSYCAPYFSEMQGAASMAHPVTDRDILWTAQSYGRSKHSDLHIMYHDSKNCFDRGKGLTHFRKITYPPGLEDIFVDGDKHDSLLWMLTEFGGNEDGSLGSNNRYVFGTRVNQLFPVD